MTTEAGQEDRWNKILKAIDKFYEIRHTYFPTNQDDKLAKMSSQFDLVLRLVSPMPDEQTIVTAHRANFEYARGKMLDIIHDYYKEVTDHSGTKNLNRSLVDPCFSVGKCMLEKGDLLAAKNYFILALNEGPNKNILCELSMLTRKMAQGAENQAELIEESIQYARKAITLDDKDGSSWRNLGNLYLESFFATGAVNRNKLAQSLNAYQNAMKDKALKSNPDLQFNCAIAHRYMENLEMALAGFEAAASLLDPGHEVQAVIRRMRNQVDKLDNAFKGHSRAKKWSSFKSDPTYVNPNTSHRMVTIDTLLDGLNKGVAILGTALSFIIIHEIVPPMYYVTCDSDKGCFVLSLFKIQYDMIKTGDKLILKEPFYHQYDFSRKRKYQFKLIRLDDLSQLIVNGKNLFQ